MPDGDRLPTPVTTGAVVGEEGSVRKSVDKDIVKAAKNSAQDKDKDASQEMTLEGLKRGGEDHGESMEVGAVARPGTCPQQGCRSWAQAHVLVYGNRISPWWVGLAGGEQQVNFFHHPFFIQILKMGVLMHGDWNDVVCMTVGALEYTAFMAGDAIL